MTRWRQEIITGILLCAAAAVLLLTLSRSVRRTARLTLPETTGFMGTSIEDPVGENNFTVVEVTPETVQAAVATLSRPAAYSRMATMTQFWSGGSGSCTSETSVLLPWTRVDVNLPDGRVRHSLTNGESTYIWYDSETAAFRTTAGGITSDNEQQIPTYEDVLNLPVDRITKADYRVLADENCIYLETEEDEGRSSRWWISVETGLLAAAERLAGGETIYRMEALPIDNTEPPPERFLLPDGSAPEE